MDKKYIISPPVRKHKYSSSDITITEVANKRFKSTLESNTPSPTLSIQNPTSLSRGSSPHDLFSMPAEDPFFQSSYHSEPSLEITVSCLGKNRQFKGYPETSDGHIGASGSHGRLFPSIEPSDPPLCVKVSKSDNPARLEREKDFSLAVDAIDCEFLLGAKEIYIRGDFIFMEEVQGKEPFDLILDPTVSLADRIHIARDISIGLYALYENGIVHKDLKPENIMVQIRENADGSKTYIPKLIDYGLYARTENDTCYLNISCGTINYLSSEILNKKEQSKAVDTYAFGMLLHLLIAQKDLCPLAKEAEVGLNGYNFNKRMSDQVDIQQEDYCTYYNDLKKKDLAPLIHDIVYECTKADPSQRPLDKEILARLEDIICPYPSSYR